MPNLIQEAKNGKESAINQLYKDNKKIVYGFLVKETKNETLAEHIQSITFEKAFDRIETYDEIGNQFSTWLIAIAKNTLLDHYRKKKAPTIVELSEEDEVLLSNFHDASKTIEEELISLEKSEQMNKMLNRLTAEEKEIITLRFFEDKSYREISNEINQTLDVVRTRLFRAKKSLKNLLTN
jgi:RNA polymerase sigma-70 factor (ECF subfamily)